MATYRSRNARYRMTWVDWQISIAMAFPFALLIGLVILIRVFG